ncbi:sugar phosphate isomerase/epimerase [Conexibacter sp. CPCC 206217]|uniref:sugar phosphate isomerase/epimerase family protein n=1 Tax=Conexibacter sp. CPCC 206217 TaxID=3064574 RepID=UPI00271C7D61|nr:sugar phosphate isomerase/epimerase family protein [Conexibacter sp. CPCC 206217]MDO8213169.1 sugar phosphate isomerase/epimerase family protein [Conexibacter sp. CPCC 206217]
MSMTADQWPIGAALLQFPGVDAAGRSVQDAPAEAWAKVLDEVAAAGFDHVDVTTSWLRPGDLEPERLRELARCVEGAGLRVSAISIARQSVIDPDDALAREHLASTLRTVDAAVVLGASVVGTGLHRPLTAEQEAAEWFWLAPWDGDPHGDSQRWELAVQRLREVGAYAAERGVQVSLELYEESYLGTADDAVRLVREIGLANVGINPDIGNLVRLHRPIEPWESVLEKVLPYAKHWHLKNYFRDHDPATGAYFTTPAPAELGVIDYRRALKMALDAGFSGPICVEHYGGDGLSVSARNRDYLRELLRLHLRDR